MKQRPFYMDSAIYELLVTDDFKSFTTLELRDAYAKTLEIPFDLKQLRIYCYEQILRLLRTGWLVRNDERFKRGQVFWRRNKPNTITVNFVTNGFSDWMEKRHPTYCLQEESSHSRKKDEKNRGELVTLLKEIELFLNQSKGEIECYQSLMEKIPEIKVLVAPHYQQAKDQYLQLQGQRIAIEKTLALL